MSEYLLTCAFIDRFAEMEDMLKQLFAFSDAQVENLKLHNGGNDAYWTSRALEELVQRLSSGFPGSPPAFKSDSVVVVSIDT